MTEEVKQDTTPEQAGNAVVNEVAAEEVNELDVQLAAVVAELEKARADILYAKAEAENVRRRALEETDKARKFAVEKFARELLGVKDALEMALLDQSGNFEALKTGVDMTQKALVSAFEKFDLKEIAPALGDKLDPNLHQAISAIPADAEPNAVVQVLQKGYQLSGRLLRPAMVMVAAPK